MLDKPYHHIMEKYDGILRNIDERAQSRVDYVSNGRIVFNREWFGDGIRVFFENEMFVAPRNYDIVLENCYGDYMTMPPKEKRITNHPYSTYWL